MKATRIIRLAATALLLSCFFAAASAVAQAGVSVKLFGLPDGTPLFAGEKTRIEITVSNDSDVSLQGFGVRLEASDNLFFSQGFGRSRFFFGQENLNPREKKKFLAEIVVAENAPADSNVSMAAFAGTQKLIPLQSFGFPVVKSPLQISVSVDASGLSSGNDAKISVSTKNVSKETLRNVSAKAVLASGLFSAKPDVFIGTLAAGEGKDFSIAFNSEPEPKGKAEVLLDAGFSMADGTMRTIELPLKADSSFAIGLPVIGLDFNIAIFLVVAAVFLFFAFQKISDPKWFNPGLAAKRAAAKAPPAPPKPPADGEKLNKFK
ncbi:MAG: hypothetical protein HY394_04880 [Candidatus Diapherotrites archaeon]|nr:hypothetical protein [Candidatus Diapherotrites archaeon]